MTFIKLNNQSLTAVSALPAGLDTGESAEVQAICALENV